jgi:hypothetical protein
MVIFKKMRDTEGKFLPDELICDVKALGIVLRISAYHKVIETRWHAWGEGYDKEPFFWLPCGQYFDDIASAKRFLVEEMVRFGNKTLENVEKLKKEIQAKIKDGNTFLKMRKAK